MPLEREEYPVGMICQSGIFLVGARYFSGGAGMGVDLGNACDVGLVDALSWLGRDSRVRVVTVHAEGIPEGRRFVEVAREISRRIPVLVLKTGRSSAGARAATSHTGALTGEDRVVDAALRSAGVLRVDDIEDLLDLSRGFLRLPPMRGRRVAVVTFTGGGGISVLDAMETWGLEAAPLASETMEGLQEFSPPWMPLGNPMDVFPALLKHGVPTVYGRTLRDAVRDPGVDAVLCISLGSRTGEVAHMDTTKLIAEISVDAEKPIVAWFYGPGVDEARARLEAEGRAMAVPSPERGARLLARMAAYERWKDTEAG
jgi:acetyltransferase